MDKAKLTKCINIAIFILMLDALVKVVSDNVTNLKLNCILLIVYVLIDVLGNIWNCKDVK